MVDNYRIELTFSMPQLSVYSIRNWCIFASVALRKLRDIVMFFYVSDIYILAFIHKVV